MNPSKAIRAALRGHDPSEEQWRAITHDPVPVAIVAGAGSGKTAVMAARMAWMVEEGIVHPSRILGLTFTNKAAGELEERLAAAFAAMNLQLDDEPTVATYHSFADRLIREHGVRVGIDPEVGLLSEAQCWQLLLAEFDRLPPFETVESRSPSSICRTVLGLADQCANHLVTPERIAEEDRRIVSESDLFPEDVVLTSRRRIELVRVVRAYLDAKARARRIDFGDQVTKAVEVLERFPEVAELLRERYPAILLDEYQDTNVAQRRLMQLLAPTGHNVTAVGDARQNIFQWRGSTLYNLIDFPTRHFLRSGDVPHRHLSLSENYRCGERILALANRIIEPVPPDHRPGNPLRPHAANGAGWVGVRLLGDQHEEAAFIAEEIEGLHGRPTADGRPPVEWRDVAILVRRKSLIPRIYDALTARSIPVEVVGLGGLLHVPEVMDVVAWLRVIADPGPPGNVWLARILLGPRFRIHYRDLALLARWASAHTRELSEAKKEAVAPDGGVPDETEFEPDDVAFSLTEALDHLNDIDALAAEARRRLERARTELASLRRRAGGPLLDLVQAVVVEAGIGDEVEILATEGAEPRMNLTSFLGSVSNFDPISGDPSLGAFLAYLDAAVEVDETLDLAAPAGGDSVKLMTVHQAKGLEFEAVFIPGVAARCNDQGEKVDSVFPDTRTSSPAGSPGQLPFAVREDAEHLPTPWRTNGRPKPKAEFSRELKQRAIEDERRLFYVALTRAKQRVYVTAAWWYERQARVKGRSLFFDEAAGGSEAEDLGSAEAPPANPLIERMAALATWPPVPHRLAAHPPFPESSPVALDRLLAGVVSAEEILGRLGADERAEAERLLAEHRSSIANLARAAAPRPPELPASLPATQLVDFVAGRAAPAALARPLPQRPSVERRIGVEVHRWIEEQARALTGIADEEALDEPAAHVDASRLEGLKEAFHRMGFAARRLARLDSGEPMAELRFSLKVGTRLVRGRIDAVYESDDGLEIVDFKTGTPTEPGELDQLVLYAAALADLGVAGERPITLTYCSLSTGTTQSRRITGREAREAVAAIAPRLEGIPTEGTPTTRPTA
ncbi:MAG: UvrD-helicase domain-containing protein [Actinomycetota bacterium]